MKPARVYPETSRRGFVPILIIFAVILLIPIAHLANKQFIGIRYPWEPAPFYDGNNCLDEYGNVKIVFGDCPSISPRPTPLSANSDETVYPDSIGMNWKTYTNQKLQFTIKYPKDWTIDESTSSPESDFYRIFYLSKGYSKSGGPIENSVAILAWKNNNFSFDEVLTNLGYKIKKETEKKIKIGSNNFLFVTTLFQHTPESVIEGSYYGILHNDHWYIFGISVKNVSDQKKVEEILNNMMSTFKFTN